MESDLDDLDKRLLDELQRDARLSYSALGRRVGLSQPAVSERVRRLEDAGVLTAYRAQIDRARAGVAITAFLRPSWNAITSPAATAFWSRSPPAPSPGWSGSSSAFASMAT